LTTTERLYSELIAPIEERMKRTVARIVHDPEDAADALQNALASLWNNLEAAHRHPNPHAYILAICIYSSYDTIRKRSRLSQRHISLDEVTGTELASSMASPDIHALDNEKERVVTLAVASLPPQQALAVFLRLVEGESFHVIAETMGCREATVRSHVSKGKAGLRELLVDML
jgi:RNA polymerase sigma-70 factor, ECF subfamily